MLFHILSLPLTKIWGFWKAVLWGMLLVKSVRQQDSAFKWNASITSKRDKVFILKCQGCLLFRSLTVSSSSMIYKNFKKSEKNTLSFMVCCKWHYVCVWWWGYLYQCWVVLLHTKTIAEIQFLCNSWFPFSYLSLSYF